MPKKVYGVVEYDYSGYDVYRIYANKIAADNECARLISVNRAEFDRKGLKYTTDTNFNYEVLEFDYSGETE